MLKTQITTATNADLRRFKAWPSCLACLALRWPLSDFYRRRRRFDLHFQLCHMRDSRN